MYCGRSEIWRYEIFTGDSEKKTNHHRAVLMNVCICSECCRKIKWNFHKTPKVFKFPPRRWRHFWLCTASVQIGVLKNLYCNRPMSGYAFCWSLLCERYHKANAAGSQACMLKSNSFFGRGHKIKARKILYDLKSSYLQTSKQDYEVNM